MLTPEITVVVPVYNASKHIETCYNGLKQQTYQNLKIVFVNDGSTDNSLEILKEIESSAENVVVINQENSGPGAARNTGLKYFIENTNSNWIGFIDCDDIIENDYFETLLNFANEKGLDISGCQYMRYYKNDTQKNQPSNSLFFNNSLNDFVENWFSRDPKNMILMTVWGKIYNRKSVENVEFDNTLYCGEDAYFNLNVYKSNPDLKEAYLDYIGYHYIINTNSLIMSGKKNSEKLIIRLFCDTFVLNEMYKTALEVELVPGNIRCSEYYLLQTYHYACLLSENASLKEFRKIDNKYLGIAYKNANISKSKKIYLYILLKSKTLFYVIKKAQRLVIKH